MLKKDTYSLTASQWHELETHLIAANKIVEQAEPFNNTNLAAGVSLPALSYRGSVFVVKPKEVEK